MDELWNLIDGSGNIPVELKEQTRLITQTKEYPKKALIFSPGRINENIYFIVKGAVRCYTLRKRADIEDEQEVDRCFHLQNDFIGSVYKCQNSIPETQYAQALEPTITIIASIKQLDNTFQQYPQFYKYFFSFWCRYTPKYEKIADMLRIPSAVERYQYLIEKFPELIDRIPQKYLASYMGINEATLSKIKIPRK
jgi:CRP/FNR family transcriptional regulator, anaerobic regulatory protein